MVGRLSNTRHHLQGHSRVPEEAARHDARSIGGNGLDECDYLECSLRLVEEL